MTEHNLQNSRSSRGSLINRFGCKGNIMNTAFILMAQYEGQAIISLELVCRDYFTHLTPDTFQRKVMSGQIKLPITRLEPSQKSAKGIHLTDLAAYLDLQRAAAVKEHNQLNGIKHSV